MNNIQRLQILFVPGCKGVEGGGGVARRKVEVR